MNRDLNAALYAATHRGTPGDLAYYRALCKASSSVLELGAGYGRLLCALGRAGREVVGLELDGGLLTLARRATQELSAPRRRTLTVLRGDMRSFDLGQRFARVLLPYNALFCLLTLRDVQRCLGAVRRALLPEGLFAFDVWNADPLLRSGLTVDSDEAEPLCTVNVAGRAFTVFEQTVSRARTRLRVSYHYVPHDGGRAFTSHIEQRYLGSAELEALLSAAGFRLESVHGDFKGSPFRRTSPHFVVTASLR